MKHNIIIDTFTMSFKYDNLSILMQQLNLWDLDFEPTRNRQYKDGQFVPGINIMYNTDEYGLRTDCMIHVSGIGCRLIESLNPHFDWFAFFDSYHDNYYKRTAHISRLDVACDIMDGSISVRTISKFVSSGFYLCRSKILPLVLSIREQCVYFGSPRSDRLIRIYNKGMEQGISDIDWTRIEMQLRNDNAMSFYLNWREYNNIGDLFAGVLYDYLRFVEPCRDIESRKLHHPDRLRTVKWWSDLIGDVQRIPQLYLPGFEVTLDKLDHYVERHNAGMFRAYLEAHDGDLTALLRSAKHAKLSPKYKVLLSQLNQIQSDLLNDTTEYTNLK